MKMGGKESAGRGKSLKSVCEASVDRFPEEKTPGQIGQHRRNQLKVPPDPLSDPGPHRAADF